MRRTLLLGVVLMPLPWFVRGSGEPLRAEVASQEARLRRPVAIVVTGDGKRLLVANRDSGSISILDAEKRILVGEIRVGLKLSGLAIHPQNGTVLATDEGAGELLVLSFRDGSLQVRSRHKVGLTPASVRLADGGRLAAVTCLWPRRLAFVDLTDGETQNIQHLDVPFAPRQQLLTSDGKKLIVADGFSGKMAVVDVATRKIDSLRELEAHNIRGLTIDGDSLLMTHQVLHGRGRTLSGEIQTSNLITNNVRRFSLAALLDPLADIFRGERLYSLGDVERGAGDPAEIAMHGDQMVVAIGGTDEVHVGRPDAGLWTRLTVGRRPTALAVHAGTAYVANTFADSVSVIDLARVQVVAEVSLGKAPTLTTQQRGEMHFYDAKTSFESWFSCNSCHPDGHTNGRLNDNFSDGSFGTPKRVLSLLGAKDTGPWAWNGKVTDLESQVRTSLKSTMQGPEPKAEAVNDLAAFVRSLPPPPSVATARGKTDTDSHRRGEALFKALKCVNCHVPPVYTTARSFDVGLRDEAGTTHFNPPSLRGLSQAGPYFHDNRARHVSEVLTRYNHQLSTKLSEAELTDLLSFLEGL